MSIDRSAQVEKIKQKYLTFINDTPEVLSILYDANLLPEQVWTFEQAVHMVAVCEAYKRGVEVGLKNE